MFLKVSLKWKTDEVAHGSYICKKKGLHLAKEGADASWTGIKYGAGIGQPLGWKGKQMVQVCAGVGK